MFIQMKAIEKHFLCFLDLIMLCKMALTFDSVDCLSQKNSLYISFTSITGEHSFHLNVAI